MNSLSKPRFAAYLGGIFLAGVACGAFLSPHLRAVFPSHASESVGLAEQIEGRLRTELDLSDAQLIQIRPLIARNVEAIQTFHCDAMHKIEEYMERGRPQFVAVLNPAQLKRFEKMEAERKAFFEKKFSAPASTNAAARPPQQP